jgi:hypothetical protein
LWGRLLTKPANRLTVRNVQPGSDISTVVPAISTQNSISDSKQAPQTPTIQDYERAIKKITEVGVNPPMDGSVADRSAPLDVTFVGDLNVAASTARGVVPA